MLTIANAELNALLILQMYAALIDFLIAFLGMCLCQFGLLIFKIFKIYYFILDQALINHFDSM
jgi:hypothetical protein